MKINTNFGVVTITAKDLSDYFEAMIQEALFDSGSDPFPTCIRSSLKGDTLTFSIDDGDEAETKIGTVTVDENSILIKGRLGLLCGDLEDVDAITEEALRYGEEECEFEDGDNPKSIIVERLIISILDYFRFCWEDNIDRLSGWSQYMTSCIEYIEDCYDPDLD